MQDLLLYTKKVLEFLLLKNPERTSLGALFGVILYEVSKYFFAISWYATIATGILSTNMPTYFSYFKRKPSGKEEIDDILQMIENSNLTKAEKRQRYRNLIDKVIAEISTKGIQEEQRPSSAE